MMGAWQLFIDESGNSSAPGELLVVGGLLVGPVSPHAYENELHRRIAERLPFAHYPPHATRMNTPAGLVASYLRLPESKRRADTSPMGLVLAQGAEFVRRTTNESSASSRVLDAASRGLEADWEDLKEVNQLLSVSDRPLETRLRVACSETRDGLTVLLREHGLLGVPAFVVAAATHVADPICSSEPEPQRLDDGRFGLLADPYLLALEALLRRVFGLLRGTKGPEKVQLLVATRHVGRADWKRPTPLSVRDLNCLVQRAVSTQPFPGTGLGDRDLRVVPWATQDYDRGVHPGIVLADAITNRLRRVLLRVEANRGDWEQAERQAARTLQLPLAHQPPWDPSALPALTTDGAWLEALDAAFSAGKPSPATGLLPWQEGQAQRWLAAALDAHKRGTAP